MDKIVQKIKNIFKKNEEKKPFAKPMGYKNNNSSGYISIK
tara:strand:+ start:386 stop:505 length:120 start_codon:yes stop_codon:yes gene_type:complete